MIEVRGLTKRYGSRTAVDGLSFDVRPGRVTGFLGPNGAGKSTTLRMVLDLDRPTAGSAHIGGRRYRELACPLREVGALLDAGAAHGGRTARGHLLILAESNRIGAKRVDEVLARVGLEPAARTRIKGFSLGMRQRLGIAAALLGDPPVLLFDEPVNGLDPEGIRWIRDLMRSLAAEGRTVLVSSHLMSEMAVTADHLIVIGQGRLLADTGMSDFITTNARTTVLVRSPRPGELACVLDRAHIASDPQDDGSLLVAGVGADAARIGDLAAEAGLPVHELTVLRASLEDAYLAMTAGATEFAASKREG
ncbi:ABC transporter ATP-binding protein [Streptomyces pratensis]|uniref:ABC transporter ATP-binding protein n=1 Tax=Streptomyces pratensis TaxID=1169025 RepID=UPI00301B51BA